MAKFNMNSSVKIQCTDLGLKIVNDFINKELDFYPEEIKSVFKVNVDNKGNIEIPLWCAMTIFGPHLMDYQKMDENIFSNLNIEIPNELLIQESYEEISGKRL